MVTLKCAHCGVEFYKPSKEFARRIRNGKTTFYCTQSCATTHVKTTCVDVKQPCAWCGNLFTTTTHKRRRKCCSEGCAKKYSRSHVDVDNIKSGVRDWVNTTHRSLPEEIRTCPMCFTTFASKISSTKRCCSCSCASKYRNRERRKRWSAYKAYRDKCKFNFSLSDYPDAFDFSLIERYGWYTAGNRGSNLNGVSRDHIVSVKWGFDHDISPNIIGHPANCQLMRHNDNVSKGTTLVMSVDELKSKINAWNVRYR